MWPPTKILLCGECTPCPPVPVLESLGDSRGCFTVSGRVSTQLSLRRAVLRFPIQQGTVGHWSPELLGPTEVAGAICQGH